MSSAEQNNDGPESGQFATLLSQLMTIGETAFRNLGSAERNKLQSALSRATGLLDRLATVNEPAPAGGPLAKPADPIDGWVCDFAAAIHAADRAGLEEIARTAPAEVPATIAAAAAGFGDRDSSSGSGQLLDYLLGRFARLDPETAAGLRPAVASTAILAARLQISDHMIDTAEKRCQSYLQLAHAHGGLTARYEAALAELQRARGENGLAQESASRACELDPGYARAHLQLALSIANAGSDPAEKFEDAVGTAGQSPDPIVALTDLAGGLPGAVLLRLAQHNQTSHPDVARQALDLLLDSPAGNPALSHESEQAATRRQVDAYLLRVTLTTSQVDDQGGANDPADTTRRMVDDLFAAASAMYGINEEECLELLDRVLTLQPDHRPSLLMRCDAMRVRAESAVPPDRARLAEAVTAFERTTGTEPAGDREWEQRVVAGLRDSQASADPGKSFGFLIDALVRLEQSILAGNESGWTHLIESRLFRRMDMWSWAYSALHRAHELLDDNPLVLDELIVIDLTCGKYASALERIDKYPNPGPWMGAARGFAVLELGIPAEAASALEKFVALGDAPAWCLQSLATAYQQLGLTQEARGVLESILSAEGNTWSQNGWNAVAATRLGRLTEAEGWLDRWRADPSDQATRSWRLGLCRLPEDPQAARQPLIAGLRGEALPAALLGIEWDLEVVRGAVEAIDDDDRRQAGLALLRDAKVIISQQLNREPDLTDRETELDRVRHRWFPLPGDAVETVALEEDLPLATTLLTVLRGRCAAEQQQHEAAVHAYRGLVGTQLEAHTGRVIDASLRALQDNIDEAISEGDLARGWSSYLVASGLRSDAVSEDIAVRGIAVAALQRDPAGLDLACGQALSLRQNDDHVARRLLGLATSGSLSAEDLLDALGAQSDSSATRLATAIRRVETQSKIARLAGDPIRADYDLRPVRVELGSGLVPADTSSTWKLFRTDIPELRARVLEQSGLLLPGIHVRSGDDLPPDCYRVLLADLEAAVGVIAPGSDDPPITDRLEPITDAIERVVLSAPGTFMVVGELDRFAGQLDLVDGDILPQLQLMSEMVELLDDSKRSYRLLAVLRAFLDDGVRVTDWVDLVRIAIRADVLSHQDPQEVVAQLRRKVRGHLFTRPGTIGVHLSKEIDQLVRTAIGSDQAQPNHDDGLDRPTDDVMNALTAQWPAMSGAAGNPPLFTIVVEQEDARRWLQLRLRDHLLPAVVITEGEATRIGVSIVEPVNTAQAGGTGGNARLQGGQQ